MELRIARVGRAHGLRGEVAVEVRTDAPELHLAPGSALSTSSADHPVLTVAAVRTQGERWYVTFAEAADRTAAELLRGVELFAAAREGEQDAWYPHELAGLSARLADGTVVGTVIGLEHAPAQDLLVLREPSGARTLVPFVHQIVPVVDVAGGLVVLDPPGGLLADAGDADAEAQAPEPAAGAGED